MLRAGGPRSSNPTGRSWPAWRSDTPSWCASPIGWPTSGFPCRPGSRRRPSGSATAGARPSTCCVTCTPPASGTASAPKFPQRHPDVGDDLDLFLFTPDVEIDRLVLEGIPVRRERPSLANRLSGSTVYTVIGAIAPGLVVDIHHGRVGPAGQHVAFARTLARHGQRQVIGGTELSVPAPEDQLVLQGMEKVAGRRSFHLCDVLQTIAIVRRPRLDWDRVLATARAHGAWDGLSCYLHYVDEAHARLVGRPLLPVELRPTLTLGGWGHATLREAGFRFPAVRVTGRLHGSQLGRSLGQAEWSTALRLSLWPFAVVGTRLTQARTW